MLTYGDLALPHVVKDPGSGHRQIELVPEDRTALSTRSLAKS